jgi:DNA-binding CsgD family transcriptional regulator/GAF domain-containing protein
MLAAVRQPVAVEHFEARLLELRSELQPVSAGTLVDEVASEVLSDALAALPAAVAAVLSDESVGSAWPVEFVDRAIALQRELRERVSTSHARAVARVHEAFAGLDRDVSPVELVRRAPALLCEVGQFDRALISSVCGSTWLPAVLHVAVATEDEVNVALAAEIGALQIPLTNSLIETELVRRRSSALVEYAREDRRSRRSLVGLSNTRAYVAAPIVVGDRVAGFLHADAYSSPRRLSATDRAVLQIFADLFGLWYERAAMADRLREQQQTVQAALSSAELCACSARPQISSLDRTGLAPATAVALPLTPASWDGRDRGGLTPRELQILSLLATGATNGQIAARLVVSETTIKSHVKRILRKLPAANRAEAVYRYTRMARSGRRAS